MQTSVPLLYAEHVNILPTGPIRKIKLMPVKTLLRFSVIRIKSELQINQYLKLYTAVFTIIGILVATSLVVIQLM